MAFIYHRRGVHYYTVVVRNGYRIKYDDNKKPEPFDMEKKKKNKEYMVMAFYQKTPAPAVGKLV